MGESVGETRLALSRSPVKLRFWAHGSSAYYSLNFCICLGKFKIKVKKQLHGYFTGKNLIYKKFQIIGEGSHFALPYHNPRAKTFFCFCFLNTVVLHFNVTLILNPQKKRFF